MFALNRTTCVFYFVAMMTSLCLFLRKLDRSLDTNLSMTVFYMLVRIFEKYFYIKFSRLIDLKYFNDVALFFSRISTI
jgi:hypothetical protein